MKFWDILKLIRHEYRYEKQEWLLSMVLQGMIFIGVFFLLTIACDMDKVCSEYIKPLYQNGYVFQLKGYSEQDIPKLEKMGFYDIAFSNVGNQGYAATDSLHGIWLCKLQAVLFGKDIWNADLDEVLGIILFCQLTFGALGMAMLIIMLHNLSNSFAMKLMRRKSYIRMLEQLGCSKMTCQSIYYGFFGIRNILALVSATLINQYLIHLLNCYMTEKMYIHASFTGYHQPLAAGIWLSSMFLMWISFQKQWRRMDEM